MSVDAVDITIGGVILFWVGFAVGIIISSKNPRPEPKDIPDHKYTEDQAEELIEKFRNLVDSYVEIDEKLDFGYTKDKQTANAKECALIAVAEMEKALTKYGMENDELQNMDAEWRHLDKLKKFIERYES